MRSGAYAIARAPTRVAAHPRVARAAMRCMLRLLGANGRVSLAQDLSSDGFVTPVLSRNTLEVSVDATVRRAFDEAARARLHADFRERQRKDFEALDALFEVRNRTGAVVAPGPGN